MPTVVIEHVTVSNDEESVHHEVMLTTLAVTPAAFAQTTTVGDGGTFAQTTIVDDPNGVFAVQTTTADAGDDCWRRRRLLTMATRIADD